MRGKVGFIYEITELSHKHTLLRGYTYTPTLDSSRLSLIDNWTLRCHNKTQCTNGLYSLHYYNQDNNYGTEVVAFSWWYTRLPFNLVVLQEFQTVKTTRSLNVQATSRPSSHIYGSNIRKSKSCPQVLPFLYLVNLKEKTQRVDTQWKLCLEGFFQGFEMTSWHIGQGRSHCRKRSFFRY